MHILVISDIHANLAALQAVLARASDFDAAWCLGDLVGYGPDPNECIETVRQLPSLICIIGNHDAAALERLDADSFNPEARQAILWTQKTLSESSLAFLRSLPERVDLEGVTLAHGSPRHPVWEYLLDTHTAYHSFEFFAVPYCFVGHTHLPVIYQLSTENHSTRLVVPKPNTTVQLSPRAILNPGSVGQPRDRDPRAAYAFYDTEIRTWTPRRVEYNVSEVQSRIRESGLPDKHALRLAEGW
jgi:diadenosine tetraphosphatase ApaH/serine/threonine PP2A family protein phosphatase